MNKRFVSEFLSTYGGTRSIINAGTYFFEYNSDLTFHLKKVKITYSGSGAISASNFLSEAGALSTPFILRIRGDTQTKDLIRAVDTAEFYIESDAIFVDGNIRQVVIKDLTFQLRRGHKVEAILPSTLSGTSDFRIQLEGYEY